MNIRIRITTVQIALMVLGLATTAEMQHVDGDSGTRGNLTHRGNSVLTNKRMWLSQQRRCSLKRLVQNLGPDLNPNLLAQLLCGRSYTKRMSARGITSFLAPPLFQFNPSPQARICAVTHQPACFTAPSWYKRSSARLSATP